MISEDVLKMVFEWRGGLGGDMFVKVYDAAKIFEMLFTHSQRK